MNCQICQQILAIKLGKGPQQKSLGSGAKVKLWQLKFLEMQSVAGKLLVVRKLVSLEHKHVVQFFGYSLRPSGI